MLSHIASTLGLSDNCTDHKFIILTKDATSDLNFVYSEILSFYIQKNYAVVLINFAQSSSHYNHLFLKVGVNIRLMREQQNFIIIDGLSEIQKLTKSNANETTQDAMFSALLCDSNESTCLRELYLSVKKSVEFLKQTDESRRFIIFIDEISVLLNLGLCMNSLEPFVQCCRALCISNTAFPSILVVGSAYEENDSENCKLVKFLLHLAHIRIQVEGLKTGYSKDADGKITLNVENKERGTSSHQKLLFKVSEKGANMLC